ncbi:MAG: hypothetical protein ISS91_00440 [Candidatus Omnitrophica bacterium]|nr:hypothetical protein [Candidatus Omnitrophota bacterium]
MRKVTSILLITILVFSLATISYARGKSSSDILKEGLLGGGAGAIGGLASGAKGGNVWKGALAGAGVTIVGGALLDSMSGEKVDSVDRVEQMPSSDAYGAGYKEGFNNGYKQGYTQGYKDSIAESARTR